MSAKRRRGAPNRATRGNARAAPFPRHLRRPIFGPWRNPPTRGKARIRHARRAPRRRASRSRRSRRAGEAAQSRHREGNRGRRVADGTERAGEAEPAQRTAARRGREGSGARGPGCARRPTIHGTGARIFPPRIARGSRRARERSDSPPTLPLGRGDESIDRLRRSPPGQIHQRRRADRSLARARARARTRWRCGFVPRAAVRAAEARAASVRARRHPVDGRHRDRGVAGQPAARGPRRIQRRRRVDAASPGAAGEIRRRPAPRHQVRLQAAGRPADRDQGTGRGRAAPRPQPGAARRHRLGQDLHDGEGDRGDAAPCPDPRAEQDARRAALWRVQELLSRQRGRVFRLVLRLLPARSLRPAHRHLHRERILDQRADRPHAPLGDARAARTRRRGDRRVGVVHLRYRLGRDLFGDDLRAEEGRAHRPAPTHRRSRRAAIQAHPARFLSRHVPRARRHARHLPGALRGPRLAREPVRRRGGVDRGVRSAHRAEDRRAVSSSRSTPTRTT